MKPSLIVGVIGSGGREVALLEAIARTKFTKIELVCFAEAQSKNPFIEMTKATTIHFDDYNSLLSAIKEKQPNILIVGPEKYVAF
jgi:phosphoribosylamine-glycine ligase